MENGVVFERKGPIGDAPIFQWTMIMGGSIREFGAYTLPFQLPIDKVIYSDPMSLHL